MTKREFQEMNGFTDADMMTIGSAVRVFNGKIVSVNNKQGGAK